MENIDHHVFMSADVSVRRRGAGGRGGPAIMPRREVCVCRGRGAGVLGRGVSIRMRPILDVGRKMTGAGGWLQRGGVCVSVTERECACVVVCAAAVTLWRDACVRVCGRQERVWWHRTGWPRSACVCSAKWEATMETCQCEQMHP